MFLLFFCSCVVSHKLSFTLEAWSTTNFCAVEVKRKTNMVSFKLGILVHLAFLGLALFHGTPELSLFSILKQIFAWVMVFVCVSGATAIAFPSKRQDRQLNVLDVKIAFLVMPLIEEFVFRYALPVYMNAALQMFQISDSLWWTDAVCSLLFGAAHVFNSQTAGFRGWQSWVIGVSQSFQTAGVGWILIRSCREASPPNPLLVTVIVHYWYNWIVATMVFLCVHVYKKHTKKTLLARSEIPSIGAQSIDTRYEIRLLRSEVPVWKKAIHVSEYQKFKRSASAHQLSEGDCLCPRIKSEIRWGEMRVPLSE